jgi:hypothetical protein
MGTGTNVQKRLVALHHLDAPWKPAEVEQRDGRILRQGNTNEEVAIYRYVTEGSFDAYMWQALETKARFIAQVMTGDSTVRQAEDIGGQELSYAEVKAIASGNPAVLTLAEADAELKRLAVLKKHHADEQYTARKSLKELPEKITRLERRIATLAQDRATGQSHAADPLTIGGKPYARKEALEKLGERLKALPRTVTENRNFPLGVYRGLKFSLSLYACHTPEICVEGAATRFGALARDAGPQAVLNAVERTVGSYADEETKTQRDLEIAQGQLRDYETRLGARFAHTDYLEALAGLRDRLETALSSHTEALDTESIVADIHALKAAHTIEAAPERTVRKAASIEEAVTTRILHRAAAEPVPPVLEQPEASPEQMALPAAPATPDRTAEVVVFKRPVQTLRKPKATYQQRVAQDRRQMSLF